MGDDGDFLIRRVAEDLAEGVIHAAAEFGGGFCFSDGAEFELIQPIERADLEAIVDLVPGEAGPRAEVDFAEAGKDDGFEAGPMREWRECLLHALHGAGIHDVRRMALEIIGGGFHLLVAERREFHIDLATENFMVAGFDFAVAEKIEASRIAQCWAAKAGIEVSASMGSAKINAGRGECRAKLGLHPFLKCVRVIESSHEAT